MKEIPKDQSLDLAGAALIHAAMQNAVDAKRSAPSSSHDWQREMDAAIPMFRFTGVRVFGVTTYTAGAMVTAIVMNYSLEGGPRKHHRIDAAAIAKAQKSFKPAVAGAKEAAAVPANAVFAT